MNLLVQWLDLKPVVNFLCVWAMVCRLASQQIQTQQATLLLMQLKLLVEVKPTKQLFYSLELQ